MDSIRDRYEDVGLRGNPFAVADHSSDLAAEHFVDRGLPVPPPPGSTTLVQVIGDQGAGKTTHVQHWRRITPGPSFYVPRYPYRHRWARPPVEALVYADEVDRMPRPLRWRWLRDAAHSHSTIVAGTHVDLTRQAHRAGLQVITHTLGPVDRRTLAVVIERRLHVASLNTADEPFQFSDAELDLIHTKSAGVIRVAEGLCHELLADRVR